MTIIHTGKDINEVSPSNPLAVVTSYTSALSVTPSDDDELEPTKSLYVGTSGDLVVTTVSGDEVTLTNFQGEIKLSVVKVLEATTADDIIALY